jgi:hypothetical protein
LHLLASVCTQFHHLFFGRPFSRLPSGLLLNIWLTFLLLSILLTWPIKFSRLILKMEVNPNLQTAALFLYYVSVSNFRLL